MPRITMFGIGAFLCGAATVGCGAGALWLWVTFGLLLDKPGQALMVGLMLVFGICGCAGVACVVDGHDRDVSKAGRGQ